MQSSLGRMYFFEFEHDRGATDCEIMQDHGRVVSPELLRQDSQIDLELGAVCLSVLPATG